MKYRREQQRREQTAEPQNKCSKTIKLPKAVALPDSVKHVDIVAVGNSRIIPPAGESWDSWFDAPRASADFMTERDQPEQT